MVESGDGAGHGLGSGSKPASAFDSTGGRVRFTVELRPNETTIVSWKKLLRESNSNKHDVPGPSFPLPSSEDHQQSVPQDFPAPAPTGSPSLKQPAENEAKDSQAQVGPNRLSNVIERIERMYAGNSTDEEDVVLDDVPDDDEYDTEDSFIDDTELDDYFQVDNSAIKHNGFFVNRGKLERIEPTVSVNEQPKKKRRKDITKGHGESEDGHTPSKHAKIGNKGRKVLPLMDRKSTSELQGVAAAVPNLHNETVRFQASPQIAKVSLNKKAAAAKVARQDKNIAEQITGVPSSKNHNNKKDNTKLQNTSSQRSSEKDSHLSKYHSGKQLNSVNELDQSSQSKEKGRHVERFDLNIPASKDAMLTPKVPVIQRKDGSNIRTKNSMLEKAIRELEKIVAESRPPSTEVQDLDNSSQGIKRRLSPEIKQKLAKVARYAVSYGKIPKDVINRLMNIVGHLMQLRTLKRNLKIMANMGLSSKQEKDDGVRKIKQEVADMVNLQIPHIKSKSGQSAPESDDFQEADSEEKEALNQRFSMDDALENKICDLYDLYVERLEEHSGPPIRKLYEELVAFWPSGAVDTDAIKRVIFRAKERRKVLGIRRQDQEKIRKRKVVTSKAAEDTTKSDAITQASNINEKMTSKSVHSITQSSNIHEKVTNKTIPSVADARLPVAFANSPNIEKPKKEKSKVSPSSNTIDAKPVDMLPKKKVKKKVTPEAVESQFLHEKMVVSQDGERQKPHKTVVVPLTKSSHLTVAPSGSENLS